jgi:hypothetical protein
VVVVVVVERPYFVYAGSKEDDNTKTFGTGMRQDNDQGKPPMLVLSTTGMLLNVVAFVRIKNLVDRFVFERASDSHIRKGTVTLSASFHKYK